MTPGKGPYGEERGMSLRDWFAGQAMPQLFEGNDYEAENVARAAYIIADAMLKEREKQ